MVFEGDRERLRATFTEDAARYDRSRPGYPPAVFTDLAHLAALQPGARVLEIGCGTGQATRPLVQAGYHLTALELGADMAAAARHALAGFTNVEITVGAFEDWPLPPTAFDLVLYATSFQWIDPSVRVAKAAAALRPGATLAVVSTHHIVGGTETFFNEVQRCYERFDSDPRQAALPTAQEVPQDASEFDQSGHLEASGFRRYEWNQDYTTSDYLDLLGTYSGHRAMNPEARNHLFSCIARLIDTEYDGRITKRYLTQLALARKR